MSTTTKAVKRSVVLNNKLSLSEVAAVLSIKVQALSALQTLATQRLAWEKTVYKKSNDMLYSILQDCYALEMQMRKSVIDNTLSDSAKEHRAALAEFAEKQGYSFKSSTPLVNRIVQCVFGDIKRSRISNYSKVLRAAQQQGVQVFDIPSFISDGGGVEQIRLKASANYKTATQKAEIVIANATKQLGVVKSAQLTALAGSEYVNTQCVMVVTQQADGTFAVNALVRSKGVLTAALAAYYSKNSFALGEAQARQDAANDDHVRAEKINDVVNK